MTISNVPGDAKPHGLAEQRVREFLQSPDYEALVALVANRFRGRNQAEDLRQTAAVKLLEMAGHYDDQKGPIGGWAYQVVCNCFLDALRQQRSRKATLVQPGADESWPQHLTAPTDALAAAQSELGDLDGLAFSEADLAVLEQRLQPKSRLIGLLAEGFLAAVPEERRRNWEIEAGVSTVPEDHFWAATDRTEQLDILAGWLGMSRNTLSQSLLRAKKVIAALALVQTLRRDSAS